MNKLVFVTGCTGKLGVPFMKCLKARPDIDFVYGITKEDMDIWIPSAARKFYDRIRKISDAYAKGDIYFIHLAAMTGIENCNNNLGCAFNTNVKGTIRLCEAFGAFRFHYISTDYVFDGEHGDYSEEFTPNPLSYYAETKLLGEIAVESGVDSPRIIRLSHFPDECKFEYAYDDKFTSAQCTTVVAEQLSEVIFDYSKWTGYLHIGGKKTTFYDLAFKSNKGVKKESVPENTPKDTSFNLTLLNKIKKEEGAKKCQ